MRSVGGGVSTPNLYFDPGRWSKAYETQKRCSYVFCPRPFVPAVALASRIVFAEKYGLVMDDAAHWTSKTSDLVDEGWLGQAQACGLCTDRAFEMLKTGRTSLLRISPEDLDLPEEWRDADPELAERLANEFDQALPNGLPFTQRQMTVQTLAALARVTAVLGSKWVKRGELDEVAELQPSLRELLQQHLPVEEGTKLGGGEADLIAHGILIIENKILKQRTNNPHSVGPAFEWQERRYSIEKCSRVGFQVVAYRPTDETGFLEMPGRVTVRPSEHEGEARAVVRFVVPFGVGVPSRARPPA